MFPISCTYRRANKERGHIALTADREAAVNGARLFELLLCVDNALRPFFKSPEVRVSGFADDGRVANVPL